MEKDTVNRLVMELGQGNTAAFSELYDGLKSPLYSFVYNRDMTKEDMQDLLHDIFAEVIQGSRVMKNYKNCFGWIFTVAKCKAANFRKKQKRDAEYLNMLAYDAITASQRNEQDDIDRLDLFCAVKRLPEDTQRMIMLYCVHGYTYKALSEIFNKSIDRVQRQLHNGLENLKKFLNYTQKSAEQIDNLIVEVFSDGQF